MSNQHEIDSELLAINSIAKIGASLHDSTRVTTADIATLFEIIDQKADWLYDQLNQPAEPTR